jgi:hypothetical protein
MKNLRVPVSVAMAALLVAAASIAAEAAPAGGRPTPAVTPAAFATPAMSAAPDGAGTATAAEAQALPSTELSSAAVTSLGGGRTDLFSRSSAGHLVHQYRPPGGSWTRSLDLGGPLRSQPAAVSWAPGRLDVFARGTDDALWHPVHSRGRWLSWARLGGVLTSAPAVAAWAPGRLDVFARGVGDALYHKWYVSGQGWSAWERLGGVLSSSPTVASWASQRLDVFARGGGNAVYHKWFNGAGWYGWEKLGGNLTSQPAAASAGFGLLDVAVRGSAGVMWLRSYARGSGWTGWGSRGGQFASGPGAAATGARVRLVGRWTTGYIYESLRPSPGAAWSAWIRVDPYLPFRRLATWVDVFDYATLDPATAVPDMRARGVRVLFLATARFNGTADFYDATEAGQWLDLAHQNGMKVVGWYLPAYGDMARDVRRTVAIANFVSPGGQRFDAIGVDIERLDEVSLAQFNLLAVAHLSQVRAQTDTMLGAIVPSPYATDPGNRWARVPLGGHRRQQRRRGPHGPVVAPRQPRRQRLQPRPGLRLGPRPGATSPLAGRPARQRRRRRRRPRHGAHARHRRPGRPLRRRRHRRRRDRRQPLRLRHHPGSLLADPRPPRRAVSTLAPTLYAVGAAAGCPGRRSGRNWLSGPAGRRARGRRLQP